MHPPKSAARHKFDMAWLHRSPISVGRRGLGGYFTRSNYFYLPSLRIEEGGGVSTLWCLLDKDMRHLMGVREQEKS
jgi:hypothetical protein